MNWQDIEGWFSEQDAKFVGNICSKIYNGVIVEIGVFAGRSTAIMSPICIKNNTEYFAIDNFCGSSNPHDIATRHQKQRDIKKLFISNMEQMNLLSNIKVIQSNSVEAANLFDDNSIDFCFIDADHSPLAVQKDIIAWWPKIKNDGYLGGHDYQSPLRHVVDMFAKQNKNHILDNGKCWCIKKD